MLHLILLFFFGAEFNTIVNDKFLLQSFGLFNPMSLPLPGGNDSKGGGSCGGFPGAVALSKLVEPPPKDRWIVDIDFSMD